jgi:hypothetical protein
VLLVKVRVSLFDDDTGIVVGADQGGLHYDGTFAVEHGEIKAKVTVKGPTGATLATGFTATVPFAFALEFSVPREDLTMPIRNVRLPDGGVVRVQLRPIRVVP